MDNENERGGHHGQLPRKNMFDYSRRLVYIVCVCVNVFV